VTRRLASAVAAERGGERKRRKKFATSDGIELVGDAWGDPARPGALLLHGGGQTRHAWKRTAHRLAEQGYHALDLDLRGHGESGWSPSGQYTIDLFADDVRRVARTFAGKPVLIGASLGGLASLIAEGEAAESIASALVLVDVTPHVEADGVARIRGFMATHLEDGFATLEEAADAIAKYLPHRPRPRSLEGLRKNLRLGKDGRYRWHYDPAFVRGVVDRSGGGWEERLWAAASRIKIPMLLVRGGASELVSDATAREFVRRVPHAAYVDVAEARHMVAGDVNDPFTSEVVAFLARLPVARRGARKSQSK